MVKLYNLDYLESTYTPKKNFYVEMFIPRLRFPVVRYHFYPQFNSLGNDTGCIYILHFTNKKNFIWARAYTFKGY